MITSIVISCLYLCGMLMAAFIVVNDVPHPRKWRAAAFIVLWPIGTIIVGIWVLVDPEWPNQQSAKASRSA